TQITATAPPGTGTVQVTATTPSGTSNGLSYTYIPAPTLTSLNPTSGPTGGGTTVTLTGTNLNGATQVKFGTANATFTVVSNTQITATAPPGTGTVQVTATTPSGTSNGLGYTYTPAPTLTSLVPASGPAAGGTTVTLTGTNLTGATQVKFGSTNAPFTVLSPTQINATAPPGTGTVQVTVVTPDGTSNGLGYTYVTAPVIGSVTPLQGPTPGGNTVVLTGSGLAGATAVKFGNVPAASFTVVSGTQINAVAPPGAAGPVTVEVTTPGGTNGPGAYYFYVAAPAVTAVFPNTGPTAGGNTVSVTGSNLTLADSVQFGAAAAAFTVVTDNLLTAVAPPGTGNVAVSVTSPGGTGAGVDYGYIAGPVLTALTPATGPEAGGNTVTLTGSGLTTTTAVQFDATTTAFTVLSPTQVTAVVPPGTGSAAVTVTTTGGTSNSLTYTRVTPPG
ncbi:IPT/TIG domain-containing protein, partial [Streptomyces sp. NPDC001922]|uniref:IPT/TIG domain-containing protein n=1 Tax=Streptomyces sp. NPDC001922 TaxID=3364624 RepID=UPI00367794E2